MDDCRQHLPSSSLPPQSPSRCDALTRRFFAFHPIRIKPSSAMPRRRLVLCSSSARKLRVLGTNLLPGRCMVSQLYPLFRDTAQADLRRVLEQWVGLELWKRLQYQQDGQLSCLPRPCVAHSKTRPIGTFSIRRCGSRHHWPSRRSSEGSITQRKTQSSSGSSPFPLSAPPLPSSLWQSAVRVYRAVRGRRGNITATPTQGEVMLAGRVSLACRGEHEST